MVKNTNIKDIKWLKNVAEDFEIISKKHYEINCEIWILAKRLNVKNKSAIIKILRSK